MTMAVLNFIIGGVGLLCGCAVGADPVLGAMQPKGQANGPMQQGLDFMSKEIPNFMAIQSVRAGLTLLVSILLIVTAAGLLNMKSWARWLAIFTGLLALVNQVIYAVFQVVYFFPAQEKLMKQQGPPPGGGPNPATMQQMAYVVFAVVLILFCGHALALIGVMFMPSVARAFKGSERSDDREDEYDSYRDDFDDYDDYR
jgi:hypothetical protein